MVVQRTLFPIGGWEPEPEPCERPGCAPYARPERTRAHLRRHGVVALGNAELLALVLLPGAPGEDAVDLAARLLVRHGGLAGLAAASEGELTAVRGMGPARAAALHAALELGRRRLLDAEAEPVCVRTPRDIGPRLMLEMGDLEQECLRVVLLNTKNVVLAMPTVYVGGVDQVAIHPRDVFREAVRRNATGVIVAHNHPSGNPTPSPEDVATTRALVRAGTVLGIVVLDHLVVARGGYVSLMERRLGFD